MANRKRNIQMNFYVTENKKRLIDERIKLLASLFDCQCTDEGGKLVLLINTDKKGKKQAHQMKLYQKYFPSCFKPRRMLSRTRLGSTPSTSAISFTVIPR